MKYIFVVGGVMSGVGKGIVTSSIGAVLQARGFDVAPVKIDPYVNVDAGTMNPIEHGEVFVLDDGTECDQDLGNYERFLNKSFSGKHYMTTGSVYLSVINRERNLEYDGRCVEVVPHIPQEVIRRLQKAGSKGKNSVVISEIGGTVGEYQNILFLEAIRMLKNQNPNDVLVVLVSYVPLHSEDAELKTKPTQYAVRTLNSAGLQPDIIVARAVVPLDKKRKQKLAFHCGIPESHVISAPDVESIYDVPLNFERARLSEVILKKLSLSSKRKDMAPWRALTRKIHDAREEVKIGIVGKYFSTGDFVLADSYISVIEAIKHAAAAFKKKAVIEWIDSQTFEKSPRMLKNLSDYQGIIVPGGFGKRGVEGKIAAIKYLREHKIPYFGLCYGMQLAVVEFTRSVLKRRRANTTEIDPKTSDPVIDILPEQKKNLELKKYGGTMRLGSWPAVLKKGSIARVSYGKDRIHERHRHRYEVNPAYIARLEKAGLVFSGTSADRRLMEIMELPMAAHPFFVGTQFHPELISRPFAPHPLFKAFMQAASKTKVFKRK